MSKATLGAVVDVKPFGRIELRTEKRWVKKTGGGSGTFTLEQPGWRVSLNGTLRPKPGMTTTLWVRIDKKDGQRRVINGRMEVRAFF